MSDDAPPMHGSWWRNYRPLEGDGWFGRRPHHGHLHSNELAPPAWSTETWRLSQSELKDLVAGTKGFYVRDWSVGLGWNNLRYIIEASLLHAKLLNRVDVCSEYGLFVERSDVIGWDKWSGAPLDTLAWQLPIQLMLDLPHLRKTYPVILTSEFYELHGLNPGLESLAGDWNHGDENTTVPYIHTIPNGDYDPSHIVRVDTLHGLQTVGKVDSHIDELLKSALGERKTLLWDDAIEALQNGSWILETEDDMLNLVNSAGWVPTFTFMGAGGLDYTKTVVDPIIEVVPRSRLRGLVEDFTVTSEVLLLEGETHLGRKPGGLRFTTEWAREAYANLVLFGFRPIPPIRNLVKLLAERMKARCGGRMWMSAHMRRGDFTVVGWVMEGTIEAHLKRIRNRLDTARSTLEELHVSRNIFGATVDREISQKGLPLPNDPFFLATDERNATGLAYLRNNSAVLIHDLLTIEDRRAIGWPLLFTDILALVEQSLAAESAFFYGHSLSSFAGGVLNIRTAKGADPRTTKFD